MTGIREKEHKLNDVRGHAKYHLNDKYLMTIMNKRLHIF